MRIAVVGVGHVGLVSAACFAELGHSVVGMDDDHGRVRQLARGVVPFYEPGLEELVQRHVDGGALTFTGELAEAVAGAEVVFVCVGTPSLPGGGADLSFVEAVGRGVARAATDDLVLVEKSTVPVKTSLRLEAVIAAEHDRAGEGHEVAVASNPEFLREGSAVEDTLHPDRIVLGVPSPEVGDTLRRVYEPLLARGDVPVVETDLATAELIKHASNAFLAMRISYMNALARLCERTGADVSRVAEGMGHDQRIGHAFLEAGLGYGGSCFPKDVDAFIHIARELGYPFRMLEEVRDINLEQRQVAIDKVRVELGSLRGRTITLLGAAFKPGTDDLREAPAVHIARSLLGAGAHVRAYDPVALEGLAKLLPGVEGVSDPLEACREADAAIVCTQWEEIAAVSLTKLREVMATPVLVDGRNLFEPARAVAAGLRYHAIGRPTPGVG
jgi:UDPglucose 6-dehydrogenase